jgi:hypothetical protein
MIEIANVYADGLSVVCDKFGLDSISDRLRRFNDGIAYQQKVRASPLEEKTFGHGTGRLW